MQFLALLDRGFAGDQRLHRGRLDDQSATLYQEGVALPVGGVETFPEPAEYSFWIMAVERRAI